MKTATRQFLKACSLSAALLGSVAVTLTISLPDVAYANNGKGNGNGGGNSNAGGNGKSGGSSNAASKGNSGGKSSAASSGNGGSNDGGSYSKGGKAAEKSRTAKKKPVRTVAPETTSVAEPKAGKIKPRVKGADGLAHPSELGALNAAHANERALENAAPNSRVGRIAAYRDEVLMGQELAATLETKIALKATLEPPTRSLSAIDAAVADAEKYVADTKKAVADLQALSDEAQGLDPDIENALAIAEGELVLAEAAEKLVKEEQAAALAYETLTAEIIELSQKVAGQPMVERAALEAAANKPVTDDVEAAVKALLGL